MFSFSFHAGFINSDTVKFPRRDIDIAWHDSENKHFSPSFKVDLFLKSQQTYRAERGTFSGRRGPTDAIQPDRSSQLHN